MSFAGLQLGQYRILRLPGSGGMGEVYLAEDERISQQVAIKLNKSEVSYYPKGETNKDVIRLFQREARAIAKLSSATASISHSIRGTPAYMAPEIWSGEPVFASDQYALAVMTNELFTGRPPFMGRQEQVMYQHFNVPPQPASTSNPALSPDIDAVLLKALQKKAADRFLSIAAFANALQQATESDNASTVVNSLRTAKSKDLYITLAISTIEAKTSMRMQAPLLQAKRTIHIPPLQL